MREDVPKPIKSIVLILLIATIATVIPNILAMAANLNPAYAIMSLLISVIIICSIALGFKILMDKSPF